MCFVVRHLWHYNRTQMGKNTKLKRTLGLPLVTLYGLGNILGAGIYVLVGKVAGLAGTSTVLAFILAMTIAAFTAFSYMELAGRYPVSASVSVYLHKAFGKKWLSVATGLAMVAGGIASAAALSKGFAGYFSTFFSVPQQVASVALIIVLGLIALKGVGESVALAALLTIVEVSGLLLVIWAGKHTLLSINVQEVFTIDPRVGFSGLAAGAFLAFYAFIGFEDMVNVAEEAKRPQRTMPLAILISLLASTLLYLLIAIIATKVISPSELADSSAPLALVYEKSGGTAIAVLGVIGMTATINGVIVQIIMGSRIVYGLAKQGWVNKRLATVSQKNKTPTAATLLIVGLMVIGTLLLPLVSLAQITSLLVLSIFTLVNAALYRVKRRDVRHVSYITVPLFVPIVGTVLCSLAILYQFYHWS